jgi:hypothetical protein
MLLLSMLSGPLARYYVIAFDEYKSLSPLFSQISVAEIGQNKTGIMEILRTSFEKIVREVCGQIACFSGSVSMPRFMSGMATSHGLGFVLFDEIDWINTVIAQSSGSSSQSEWRYQLKNAVDGGLVGRDNMSADVKVKSCCAFAGMSQPAAAELFYKTLNDEVVDGLGSKFILYVL